MFQDMQIPVIPIGEEDSWAGDQVKTLAAGDTSVTFDISTNTSYGYELFIDMSTASVPTADRPRQLNQMDFSVSGKCTVIFITPILSSQVGAKAKLRVFK